MGSAGFVGTGPVAGGENRQLKRFLFDNMYRHYRVVRMQVKAERLISDLFNAYRSEPLMLPNSVQVLVEKAPKDRSDD